MLRNARRNLLSLLMVLSMIVSNLTMISAQETPNEYLVKEFRINREGVTTNFVIDAVPDSMLNVQIFYDGGKKPEFNNSQSVMENVAYVNQFDVPESGIINFSFKNNEKTGTYTLRLSGQVYSASFDITGDNSVPAVSNSGGLFAMFQYNYKNIHPGMEDFYTLFAVLSDWEEGTDVYEYARSIKRHLDGVAPGRRAIFIDGSWNEYLYSNKAENYAWYDKACKKLYDKLDEFFKAFYEVGGTVDYAFTDFEIVGNGWNQIQREKIVSDPRYKTEIRPLLEGYNFPFIDETSEYWTSTELDISRHNAEASYIIHFINNRIIWNAMDAAIYQPIAKWFPAVKFSEYGASDVGRWDDWYLFGYHNDYPGTHNSPELYMGPGGMQEFTVDFGKGEVWLNSDFDELVSMMKRMYYVYSKDENAKIQPWLYTYGAQSRWADSPYASELFFHTALYNPDPFMIFSVRLLAGGQFDYNMWKEDGITLDLIKHINDVIGDSQPEDRKVIDCGEMLHNKYYLLSGMTVKNKNIYRITPDMERETELETSEDFLAAETEDEVKFVVNGQTITFPQGKIIRKTPDTAVPQLGYWVETPADVFPVQELATPGTLDGTWVANTKVFIDRFGVEANTLKKEEAYTFVLRYDNKQFNTQDVTVLMGEYDNAGKALSFEVLGQETAVIGQYGRFVFKLPELKADTHSVKIFTWDNLSNLKPLKLVRDILCEN